MKTLKVIVASCLFALVLTDAKDKITGTPVPFNPMMLGRPGAAGAPPQP